MKRFVSSVVGLFALLAVAQRVSAIPNVCGSGDPACIGVVYDISYYKTTSPDCPAPDHLAVCRSVSGQPAGFCAHYCVLAGKHGIKSSYALVQATVGCGNVGEPLPNVASQDGTPGCDPPVTFDQDAGSPTNGWRWRAKGGGVVSFSGGRNKIFYSPNPALNPQDDSSDMTIGISLYGVSYDSGPADGQGTLQLVTRETIIDRESGAMTLIDFPYSIPLTVVGGKAKVKTSLNARRNANGLHGLPTSTVQILSLAVEDENGNVFAVPGMNLP